VNVAVSLDAVFKKKLPSKFNLDSVEPKLFASAVRVTWSVRTSLYLGYASAGNTPDALMPDNYHPTEGIADKISSVLEFLPEFCCTLSRGRPLDSDHVVTLTTTARHCA